MNATYYAGAWTWGAGGDVLCHIGTKTSGRYPRGSGERPWQHEPGRAHARVSEKKALSKETAENKRSSGKKSGPYVYEPLVKRILRGSSGQKPRLRALTKKEIEARVETRKEERIKKEAFEKEAAKRKAESEALVKETEERISKAIASGDRKEILRMFDKMTTAELRVASDRVRLKEELSRVPENQIYKGKATLYKAVDILNKTSSGFKAAADIRKSVNTLLGINNNDDGKKGNKNKNQDNKDKNKNQDKDNKQEQSTNQDNKGKDKKYYPNLDKLGKAVSEVANGVADHPGETKRVLERLGNQIKQQQERLNKKKEKKGGD